MDVGNRKIKQRKFKKGNRKFKSFKLESLDQRPPFVESPEKKITELVGKKSQVKDMYENIGQLFEDVCNNSPFISRGFSNQSAIPYYKHEPI